MSEANPKTLTGRRKLPTLSVIPPTALLYLGMAMKYGAHDAPKVDGTTGYGPYNWRDQPIAWRSRSIPSRCTSPIVPA